MKHCGKLSPTHMAGIQRLFSIAFVGNADLLSGIFAKLLTLAAEHCWSYLFARTTHLKGFPGRRLRRRRISSHQGYSTSGTNIDTKAIGQVGFGQSTVSSILSCFKEAVVMVIRSVVLFLVLLGGMSPKLYRCSFSNLSIPLAPLVSLEMFQSGRPSRRRCYMCALTTYN